MSWTEAEPGLLDREKAAMIELTGEIEWVEDLVHHRRPAVGWRGKAPRWVAERAAPDGLDRLLAGRRLELVIAYPEGFPLVPPALVPTHPEIPIERRTMSKWHVMGDGSLCLIQAAEDWHPDHTAADLVRKAVGWFIEYLLLEEGRIEKMTENGIFEDDSLDQEIARST